MSDEESKITLLSDEADGRSRKKQSGIFVKPVAATAADNDEEEEDETITPRRRRSSKDKRNKKKKKSSGKKKDDVSSGDETKDDVRSTLASLANEIEEHRAQIVKLEQKLTEIARSNNIDPSEYLKSKYDVTQGPPPSYNDAIVTPKSKNIDDVTNDVKLKKDNTEIINENEKSESSENSDIEGKNDNSNNNSQQQTSIYKAQKISKLERLTGRRDSLSKIQPFLMAETPDEAMKNAQMLWSSDHFKRMYGSRPIFDPQQQQQNGTSSNTPNGTVPNTKRRGHRASKSTTSAVLTSKSITGHSKKNSQDLSTRSRSSSSSSSIAPPDSSHNIPTSSAIPGSSQKARGGYRRRSSSWGSNSDGSCEPPGVHGTVQAAPPAGLVINRKVDKLNKLTGRRDSIGEIMELLDPKTPAEARACAQSLYSMEAMKKKLGTRLATVPRKGKGEDSENDILKSEKVKKNDEGDESLSSSSEVSDKYHSGSADAGASYGSNSVTTLNDKEIADD